MAIAIVSASSARNGNSGGTSNTVTFAGSVTVGNLLVLCVTLYPSTGSTDTITSVTDSKGNTWSAGSSLAQITNSSVSHNPRVQVWYSICTTGGASNTVTANFSGTATYSTLDVMEFSGCASASVVDASATIGDQNINTGAVPTTLPLSITTTQDNSLLIGVAVCNNAFAEGSTYTTAVSSGSWAFDRSEYKLDAGAAGSKSVTFSDSVGLNDNFAIAAVAFKIAGGGVPTTNYYPGSDITPSGWTTSTGSGTLASMLSETSPSDADYDQSAVNPSTDVLEVKFFNVQTPSANTNHTVSYRIKGDNSTNLRVDLVCNTTIIKTWTHNPAPSAFTQYDQTLTTVEAGTISDYSNLRLRVTAG